MLECLGLLTILAGEGGLCGERFDPRRYGEVVRVCQLAYQRLEISSARLIDREARTRGVLQGYRGSRRIARFVEITTRDNPAAMSEGGPGTATMAGFAMTVGNAQTEQPETDPNRVQAMVLAGMAGRCDAQLTRWAAPPSDEMPEAIVRTGFAEFRVNGHDVAETFAQPATADLARAACDGPAPDVARAVASGGDLRGVGLRGMTPLAWAITCENLAGIAALLEAGADPNQPIGQFGTPVALAAGYRNSEILRLLLRHGGSPNAESARDSALSITYVMGRLGSGWTNFEILLEAGADINRPGPDHSTVVETALVFADYERILALLERGYTGDLAEVASSLALDERIGRAAAGPWRDRVKAWLQARAVPIPVLPTPEPIEGFPIEPPPND